MTSKVLMVREVQIKYGRRRPQDIVAVRGPKDIKSVADALRNTVLAKNNTKEHFMIVMLDAAHQVIGYNLISVGTANSAPVHIREVFQPAILAGATAIIVAHNHPSNELTISKEDVQITNQLHSAGALLGIKVLDHIILGDDDFVSFADRAMMPTAARAE